MVDVLEEPQQQRCCIEQIESKIQHDRDAEEDALRSDVTKLRLVGLFALASTV